MNNASQEKLRALKANVFSQHPPALAIDYISRHGQRQIGTGLANRRGSRPEPVPTSRAHQIHESPIESVTFDPVLSELLHRLGLPDIEMSLYHFE